MITYKNQPDIPGMQWVFNSICDDRDVYYKPLEWEDVAAKFTGDICRVICAYEGDIMIGFAAGNANFDRQVGYISYVGVLQGFRRRGIGTELLKRLESELSEFDYINKFETVFYNPTHLEWFIPDNEWADHPCAPGTDKATEAYRLMLNHGYFEWTVQNSYFLQLENYQAPDGMTALRDRLAGEGIEITLYDKEKHTGLSELFDDINNQSWKSQVTSNTDKPIVVAVDTKNNNLVVAYTGPLSTDRSGRGNFCGIGTVHAYRGRGIGKCVFCEMCRIHRERGALFMSLYTGDTNPARNIYEAAGFKIVRSWGNLRKVKDNA